MGDEGLETRRGGVEMGERSFSDGSERGALDDW